MFRANLAYIIALGVALDTGQESHWVSEVGLMTSPMWCKVTLISFLQTLMSFFCSR
eukprot:c17596_g1_i2 orf=16-183(-)